ncbi:hypothetical protein CSC2_30930 [Clostridium zeae]|uniref:Phage structural protein n=1 Tax=Clostridium zeae TaxID=2759022 RepID=A0ABQ1ECP7_9CLOT|nr:hypothetical protein [Clostridium zeae]GFZ32567.1 hypothetical protein CSC2_30930 [Clostridium zeae]
MAQTYGFFNSATGDTRQYRAEEFAELFSSFFNSGLANTGSGIGLKVNAGTGMVVNIDSGYSVLKGYYYKNDTSLSLSIDAADSVLNRIDRVVLRLDFVARTIKAVVKKGSLASTPVAPVLQRDSSVYELSLAQVKVNAKATTVVIVDERLDKNVCGLVSIAAEVPDQEMWDKFNLDWSNIQNQWNNWFNNQYNKVGSKIFVSTTQPTAVATNDIWVDI